jgi:hypothetical protein
MSLSKPKIEETGNLKKIVNSELAESVFRILVNFLKVPQVSGF